MEQNTTAEQSLEDNSNKGDTMSSLSDQHSASPFSEYSELCKGPPLSSTGPPQSWNWQHPSGLDIGPPRGLLVSGGSLAAAGLTDEDKLCFFEQPGRGGMDAELKVPGQIGGMSGSPSLGNTSLGSAGESPDSLSSSPSPSPASPGRLPSSLQAGASHSTTPRNPVGALMMEESPTDGISPSESWDNSDFPQSSPKVAMPQVASNYCVIDKDVDRSEEVLVGAESTLAEVAQMSRGSTGDNSEEDEMEEEEDLEPCLMGRAQQQRKAMRRAMSECTHLSVPTSLDLSDKYPGGDEAGLDQLASPMGGPRRPPHSMKRSLTVAEDQPPTPPPTLSAAGATQIDLRQSSPEPRLRLSPFPPLKDSGFPMSPVEPLIDGFKVEKDPGSIVLPVPPSPKGFSDHEEETGIKSTISQDLYNKETETNTQAGFDFGTGTKSTVAWDFASDLANTSLGLNPNSNPFITMEGRWTGTQYTPPFLNLVAASSRICFVCVRVLNLSVFVFVLFFVFRL